MVKKVLTYHLSEPINGATAVQVDINNGDGNLTIDSQTGGEPVLASGALEYLEKQGEPTSSINTNGGKTCFTLKAGKGGQPWIHMPWSACNGATTWLLHLNPKIQFEMTAYTAGGNVFLDLSEMDVTRVAAETGGGNIEVILPDTTANLSLTAKSGAGNVVVSLPAGTAVRIQASSGLGRVMVYSQLKPVEKNIFQSPGYDQATIKLEITVRSGAGNVVIKERSVQYEQALP